MKTATYEGAEGVTYQGKSSLQELTYMYEAQPRKRRIQHTYTSVSISDSLGEICEIDILQYTVYEFANWQSSVDVVLNMRL